MIKLIVAMIVLLAVLVTLELTWAHHHKPTLPWHDWPGFQAAWGVVIGVALVVLAKAGKAILQRPPQPEQADEQ